MPCHTVRRRTNLPVAAAPWWKQRVQVILFLINRAAWKAIGVPPPDHPEGGYNEGFHSFTDWDDAVDMMRTKGPGWFIETTPLDHEDPLPEEMVTFGDTVFPIGDTVINNGTKALPVPISQGRIKALEVRTELMLDQASRMIAKNRSDIARANSA